VALDLVPALCLARNPLIRQRLSVVTIVPRPRTSEPSLAHPSHSKFSRLQAN